jgi:hypothetical protein
MCCGNIIRNHKLKLAVPEIFRSNTFSVLPTHPLEPYHYVERTVLWWHSYPLSIPPSPLKHGLTQHEDCRIPAKQAHQFSLIREGPPVLKSARCILHLLQVWKNVHQTDWTFNWDKGQTKNITGTSTSTILRSLQWLNTTLTWAIVSIYRIPVVAKKPRCMDQIIREVTEIVLHHSNVSREDDFSLSRSWKLLIHNLKEWKHVLSNNMTLSGGPWRGLILVWLHPLPSSLL